MDSVASLVSLVQPTNLAPLPALLAYTQSLGLERFLARPKRGYSTLALSVVWLVLAWRGSGRPEHLGLLSEPLLVALLDGPRLPDPATLRRSLAYWPVQAVRRAVEAAYQAAPARRTGPIWVALDAHQLPYWGRGKTAQFTAGWSGLHNRSLRGYRLYLATDTSTGQIITFLLARGRPRDHLVVAVLARRVRARLGERLGGVVADCGFTSREAVRRLAATGVPFILGFARTAPIRARLASLSGQQHRWRRDGGAIRLGRCPWDERLRLLALGARTPTDQRGPWVYLTNVPRLGPRRLVALYRQRWRVEQVIDELVHGHDLNHLVTYRLAPNAKALGLRLLARNLALGYQLAAAPTPPTTLAEPLAFRATAVHGLGQFYRDQHGVHLFPLQPKPAAQWHLPWCSITVRHPVA